MQTTKRVCTCFLEEKEEPAGFLPDPPIEDVDLVAWAFDFFSVPNQPLSPPTYSLPASTPATPTWDYIHHDAFPMLPPSPLASPPPADEPTGTHPTEETVQPLIRKESVYVHIERETELMLKSKLSLPWRKNTLSTHFYNVPLQCTRAHTSNSFECEFCLDTVYADERHVRGCGKHKGVHLQCAAIIYAHGQVSEGECCGQLRSRCAAVLTHARNAREIRDLSLIKLRDQAREMRLKSSNGSEFMRRRYTRLLSANADLVQFLQEKDDAVDVGQRFELHSRGVYAGKDELTSCVVCGKLVNTESSVTCAKHKTHDACYAFFRAVANAMHVDVHNECPSTLFGYPECFMPTRLAHNT